MKVPRVSILLPDLRPGGAERVVVNLANALVARGVAVDLVLVSGTGSLLPIVAPGVRLLDLKVARFRSTFLPLTRYLRKERPDALLACMWPLTSIALWARAVARVPTRVVVAEHTTWSPAAAELPAVSRWAVRAAMYSSFPHADGIVAVSQGAADDLARFAGIDRAKVEAIYNPVVGTEPPPDGGRRDPAEWWSGPHRRILAVGTLKSIKDYRTLITAFATVRRSVDARLLILGEGECRPQLEAHARDQGVAPDVLMPGFVHDPWPYYRRADLHVLSSIAEGLPTVLIEALAAGTPIVSTDCPSGPREILCDGKFGALVPVGNPAALAAAIVRALATEHDRAALKQRANAFGIERAVDLYEALLLPDRTPRMSP